jgi:Mg2+ and Co2+ transporter CorA
MIFRPLTFIAGLMGMNAAGIPGAQRPLGCAAPATA